MTTRKLAEDCWGELLEAGDLEFSGGETNNQCIDIIQKYLDAAVNEQEDAMQVHNLKTWPDSFQPILDGKKRHEYRLNDRGFNVGDELHLAEWEPADGGYTGRALKVKVLHIDNGPAWEIPDGYCVMSISEPYAKQEC